MASGRHHNLARLSVGGLLVETREAGLVAHVGADGAGDGEGWPIGTLHAAAVGRQGCGHGAAVAPGPAPPVSPDVRPAGESAPRGRTSQVSECYSRLDVPRS